MNYSTWRAEKKREQQEEARHHEVVSAIASLNTELAGANRQRAADRRASHVVERGKARRENKTIAGLVAAAIIAFGSAYLTYMAIKHADTSADTQHEDTKKALVRADTANQTLEKQTRENQRPWVHFKSGPDTPSDDDFKPVRGKEAIAEVLMENVGKTPALKIKVYLTLEKLKIFQSPSFNAPSVTVDGGTIFPTTSPKILVYWLKAVQGKNEVVAATMSADDVKDWKAGKIYFAVYGQIEYWDMFGVEHWTQTCGSVAIPTLKIHALDDCTKRYNDADGNVDAKSAVIYKAWEPDRATAAPPP